MDKQLEEKLTNGGRVPLPVGVDARKLVAADQILEGIRKGDPLAEAEFKRHLGVRFGETLTTGDDFIFGFTHLVAVEVDNLFEAAERNWSDVIDVQTVSSFEAPKVYAIDYENVTGFERPVTEPGKPAWVPPIVPEGSPYPEFKFAGELAAGGKIHKAGGRFNLTFERIVADAGEIVPQLPGIITEFLLDREEWDAWNGLISFIDTPANHLDAGTTLDGVAVPADAPATAAAIALALTQAKQREIAGRKVRVRSYNLLVPTGTSDAVNFQMQSLFLRGIQDGNRDLGVRGFSPFTGISGVIETDYLTGTQWALVPAKGAVPTQKRFYNLGRLRGHEGPEVRVQNVTGNYVGGGTVPPFEGSFDTDSAALRGRVISGGLGWNPEYAVFSDGDGVITP